MDFSNIPSGQPPAGTTSNLGPGAPSQQSAIIGTCVTMMIPTTCFVAMRLYVCFRITKTEAIENCAFQAVPFPPVPARGFSIQADLCADRFTDLCVVAAVSLIVNIRSNFVHSNEVHLGVFFRVHGIPDSSYVKLSSPLCFELEPLTMV